MGTHFPLTFTCVSHAEDFSKYSTAKNKSGLTTERCAWKICIMAIKVISYLSYIDALWKLLLALSLILSAVFSDFVSLSLCAFSQAEDN